MQCFPVGILHLIDAATPEIEWAQHALIKSDAANQQIGEADLADVVVNVVSYSLESSQRFVMLDGKIYRENDFVRAGLRVDEIKPNAVVLNFRGELLTRTP